MKLVVCLPILHDCFTRGFEGPNLHHKGYWGLFDNLGLGYLLKRERLLPIVFTL